MPGQNPTPPNLETAAPPEPGEFTISVVLERKVVRRSAFQLPSWRLLGLVVAAPPREFARGRCIRREGDREEFLWTGLPLQLDPGAAESYWFNLVAQNPSLFVICRPEPSLGLAPSAVTADHDLAVAHMEADDTVFSAPLPPEVVPRLERFVMDHYRPQPPKGRKRKNRGEEAS